MLSTTVMVNGVPTRLLPLISVALVVTVVVPTGNTDPLAWLTLLLAIAQLSPKITLKVTGAPQVPAAAFTVMLAGTVIVGSWLSITCTLQKQVSALPLSSLCTSRN